MKKYKYHAPLKGQQAFAISVTYWMKKFGYTRESLGKEMGLHRTTIADRINQDAANMTIHELIDFCRILKWDEAEVIKLLKRGTTK